MKERLYFFLKDEVVFVVYFFEDIIGVVYGVDCMSTDTEVVFKDGAAVIYEFVDLLGILLGPLFVEGD